MSDPYFKSTILRKKENCKRERKGKKVNETKKEYQLQYFWIYMKDMVKQTKRTKGDLFIIYEPNWFLYYDKDRKYIEKFFPGNKTII